MCASCVDLLLIVGGVARGDVIFQRFSGMGLD